MQAITVLFAATRLPLPQTARLVLLALWPLVMPRLSFGQTVPIAAEVGESRTLHSRVLSEDRKIHVSLPTSYSSTTVGYPVLYLLDGGTDRLLYVTGMVQFLAAARNRIPELIVVAIPNTNRNRDLTPGPGAAAFERFLGEELIPWVEQTYRAGPERLVAGHSLGGSLVVHALLNRPALFDGYVAVSAPLWRYDSLGADTQRGLQPAAAARVALYLYVGDQDNERLRQGVERFAAEVTRDGPSGLSRWFTLLPDEDHSSTFFRSLYGSLEARYHDWRFPFFEDSTELALVGGLDSLEAHYRRFTSSFGFPILPPPDRLSQVARIYNQSGRHKETLALAERYAAAYPALAEQMINAVGYDQMRRGQHPEAVATFRRNTTLFPESLNVYDSLGDGYCGLGQASLAKRSYEQAVRLATQRSHPRLPYYQDKVAKGCRPAGTS